MKMNMFTTLGRFALCFHEDDWTEDLQERLSTQVPAAFILEQRPFRYMIDPAYLADSAKREKGAFGTQYYVHLSIMEKDLPRSCCDACPNRLKKQLSSFDRCRPCRPDSFQEEEKHWTSQTVGDIKKTLLQEGYQYVDKEAFYFTWYPRYTQGVSRETLLDVEKLPAQFHLEDTGKHYVITYPLWRFKTGAFRSEEVSVRLEKIGEEGLARARALDVLLANHGEKFPNDAYLSFADHAVIDQLHQFPFSYTLDEDTPLPARFVQSVGYDGITHMKVEKAPSLTPALVNGNTHYVVDDKRRVFERMDRPLRDQLTPYRLNRTPCEISMVFDGTYLYEYRGKADHLRFLAKEEHVTLSFAGGETHSSSVFRTFNELVEQAGHRVKTDRCLPYLEEWVGCTQAAFEVGDLALIASPVERREALRNRTGKILSVTASTVTLGFENNYFRETFMKSECFPVKQ